MRIPVHFHDEPFRRAEEIRDVWLHYGLATKLVAAELRPAEMPPQDPFGVSGLAAHPSRSLLKFVLE
jgi:hypothetical protein